MKKKKIIIFHLKKQMICAEFKESKYIQPSKWKEKKIDAKFFL